MLKRITEEEAQYYIPLDTNNPASTARAIAFTLTPEPDTGWDLVKYYGEAVFDPTGTIRNPQWVYVLVNKDMPGICKIGMTTVSVEQRVGQINSATGVISPWFPVYKYKCVNAHYLEQDVHRYLEQAGHRVSKNREGFYITTELAIQTIEELGSRYQTYHKAP